MTGEHHVNLMVPPRTVRRPILALAVSVWVLVGSVMFLWFQEFELEHRVDRIGARLEQHINKAHQERESRPAPPHGDGAGVRLGW